jgi:3-dehydroquinate synthase
MNRIKVHLDKKTSASYEIYIGTTIMDRVGLICAKQKWGGRYISITDANVLALHGEQVKETLKEKGLRIDMIDFPPGEGSKDIKTCLRICDQLMAMGADRQSALIAMGGGVVGDITGFVASVYMRGIPYVQVPTTLLAQVDSSIGGKTGIDLPFGKNLLGTFYQPKAVFIDLAFLQTLEPQELRNGLAEVVKYGIIDDPGLFSILETKAAAITSQDDKDLLREIVTRSCRIKKGVVEIDEQEKGPSRRSPVTPSPMAMQYPWVWSPPPSCRSVCTTWLLKNAQGLSPSSGQSASPIASPRTSVSRGYSPI